MRKVHHNVLEHCQANHYQFTVETRLSTRLTNPLAPRVLISSSGDGAVAATSSTGPTELISPRRAPTALPMVNALASSDHVPSLSPRPNEAAAADITRSAGYAEAPVARSLVLLVCTKTLDRIYFFNYSFISSLLLLIHLNPFLF